MYTNLYALEKHVQSRLDDARAARARAALISALRGRRGVHVSVRAMVALVWAGHRRGHRAAAGASRA